MPKLNAINYVYFHKNDTFEHNIRYIIEYQTTPKIFYNIFDMIYIILLITIESKFFIDLIQVYIYFFFLQKVNCKLLFY